MTKRQTQPKTDQLLPAEAAQKVIDLFNLSLDLGNAYANGRADNGLAFDYRSIIAPLGDANRLNWTKADEDSVIKYGDQWYVFGDRAYTLAPDTIEEYPTVNRYTSTWYKVLFAAALHRAFVARIGEGIIYPRLIVSIPAALFKSKGEAERVKANLIGEYRIDNVMGSTLAVNILPNKIVIVPEGIGTFFQFVFGGGQNEQFKTGTWVIADSGYLTLDAVFVRDSAYMPELAQSDEKTGISVVSEKLREYVRENARVRLDRATIDRGLECDSITVNEKPVNISALKQKAFTALAARAAKLVETWAAGQNLRGVILTGGGAPYLYPYMESANLPKIFLAQNPRRANVEGAYLYLTSEG